MPTPSPQPAPMISLRELVERYLALGGGFGQPVALAAFALPPAETERLFSAYDEDYHISRFFHFRESAAEHAASFSVNGVAVTHVSLAAEIQTVL